MRTWAEVPLRVRFYRVAAIVLVIAAISALAAGSATPNAWGIAFILFATAIALWAWARHYAEMARRPEDIWEWRRGPAKRRRPEPHRRG